MKEANSGKRFKCPICEREFNNKKGYRKNPGIHLREIRGGGH